VDINGESDKKYIFKNVPDFLENGDFVWRRYWGSVKDVTNWPFQDNSQFVNTNLDIDATGPVVITVWLQGILPVDPNGQSGQTGSISMDQSLRAEGFEIIETPGFYRYRLNEPAGRNPNQTMFVYRKYYFEAGSVNLTFSVPGTLVAGFVEDMNSECTSTTTTTITTSTSTTVTTTTTTFHYIVTYEGDLYLDPRVDPYARESSCQQIFAFLSGTLEQELTNMFLRMVVDEVPGVLDRFVTVSDIRCVEVTADSNAQEIFLGLPPSEKVCTCGMASPTKASSARTRRPRRPAGGAATATS